MAIICGTDLSAASAGALEVACALAAQRGEHDVVLVHVTEDEAGIETARIALDAQAAAAPAGTHVRTELVVGPADETLVSFAFTEGADLIVIAAASPRSPASAGSLHLGPGSILRLGSTAERVIASTRVPVLVVRDPAPLLRFARNEQPLKILVGIDDSVACELGIQWIHALRTRGPVDVVLGAIYYPDDAGEHYGVHAGALVDRDPEIERLLARDLLRRFDAQDRVVARPRRGLGRIGDHLVELAREESVDAIVVGTGQKTGLGRLGSVSTVIVHDATQSIICVPPNAAIATLRVAPIRSALVATDLSPFANRAVPFAFAVTPEGGDVHIAHIVERDAEVDAAEIERSLLVLAPAGMKREVTAHLVRGDDAAQTIAQTAERLGVDVICIASHGRSGISRALVGSVADRLLRATRKPVLVLRPG